MIKRPHSTLGYRPPAPESIVPIGNQAGQLTFIVDYLVGADHLPTRHYPFG